MVAVVFDTRLVLLFVFSSFTLHEALTAVAIVGATLQVTGSPRGARIIDEIRPLIQVCRVHGTYRNGGNRSRGASLTTRAELGRFLKRAARAFDLGARCRTGR
ncbi:hypothetical protein GEMMAAP_18075 [Gemmatimonas phototrophica]|uniref:Uncharacterized protein n=1 Tax=Gemmatimonas phototrophica TaxID=1379270 RepID=A0A143BMD1_9BACT|nr:hypothetical protein GEMMAAP_18075 [Gemmatimonas phototrophica]